MNTVKFMMASCGGLPKTTEVEDHTYTKHSLNGERWRLEHEHAEVHDGKRWRLHREHAGVHDSSELDACEKLKNTCIKHNLNTH